MDVEKWRRTVVAAKCSLFLIYCIFLFNSSASVSVSSLLDNRNNNRHGHGNSSANPLLGGQPQNILIVIFEDLRIDLPNYGKKFVVAPNIQRLADIGLTFDLALCQVSICAPSRSSLMTGLRPDTLGIYDFSHFGGLKHFRTIPSHFHRHGYQTSMSGKIFHWESPRYYSGEYFGTPSWEQIQSEEAKFQNSSVTPDDLHHENTFFRDAYIVNKSLDFLTKMSLERSNEPWYLSVGLKGTHMPYHMPRRFWDMYKNLSLVLEAMKLPPDSMRFPKHKKVPLIHHVTKTEATKILFMNDEGRKKATVVERYQSTGDGLEISTAGFRELYRGYLSCLSYSDYLLGKLWDLMDSLRLWENTIVVLTADHGMHVGEKGIWGKWTLFDESTRVPLVIHAPEYPSSFGKHFTQPVELIDIFPTLVDLTKVPLEPRCPVLTSVEAKVSNGKRLPRLLPLEGPIRSAGGKMFRHTYCDPLDGTSLRDAFIFPALSSSKKRSFAMSQRMTCKSPGTKAETMLDPWTSGWTDFCPFKKLPRDPAWGAMGYSLRYTDWRYIAWLPFDTNTFLPSLNVTPIAEELYTHRNTSELGHQELENVATTKEFQSVIVDMRRALYSFLWTNVSFEHLFQKRSDSVKMRSITQHRFHENAHPHHALYANHRYAV